MDTGIELRTAYYWDCPNCKNGNFVLPEIANVSPEEKEESFRHFHQIEQGFPLPEGWEDFALVYIPNMCKCSLCGKEFFVNQDV